MKCRIEQTPQMDPEFARELAVLASMGARAWRQQNGYQVTREMLDGIAALARYGAQAAAPAAPSAEVDDTEWITIAQAVKRTGFPKQTIHGWLKAGRVLHRMTGPVTEVAADDVCEWAAQVAAVKASHALSRPTRDRTS